MYVNVFYVMSCFLKLWAFEFSEGNRWHAKFLLGSHLTVHFQLIRVTTGMAIHIHTAFSPDIFSPGFVQSVLDVSLYHIETTRKHAFMNLRIGNTGGKTSISPSESWMIAALNFPENTLVHFSLHYHHNFGLFLEFSERNRLLATSCW